MLRPGRRNNDIEQDNDGEAVSSSFAQPYYFKGQSLPSRNEPLKGKLNNHYTQISVIIDADSERSALTANLQRNYLLIQNQSASNIKIGFSVSSKFGLILSAGNFYESDSTAPDNEIFLIGTTDNQRVLILEGQPRE